MHKEIQKFYRRTKFSFKDTIQSQKIPQEEWPIAWRKVFYKTYHRFPSILLPTVNKSTPINNVIFSRRTTREFSESPLEFDIVSNIIQSSAGISIGSDNVDFAKRTYPSAGARYPIETYIVANNVLNLDQGLYHFNPRDNCLECLLKEDLRNLGEKIVNDPMGRAQLLLILTGVINRSEVKYGINAYRFALIECGHIGQNISMLCEANGIGSCAIGGFDNDLVSELLDLTREEIPLYMFAIGGKNEPSTS